MFLSKHINGLIKHRYNNKYVLQNTELLIKYRVHNILIKRSALLYKNTINVC